MKKLLITLLIIACISGFLLYKGYRIIPLVDGEYYESSRGTIITGIRVEFVSSYQLKERNKNAKQN